MKKTIFSLLALVVMLATVSCSNEQEQLLEDSAIVSLSVGVENEICKRSISDGQTVDQLMYAVFNEDGTKVISSKEVIEVDNLINGYTLELDLALGHTYKVVFWAQSSACDAYEVSDDMVVTVDYEGLNNDESRDAFFGATNSFRVTRHMSKDVTLKRPFAQVNVGTYASEMEYIKSIGIDVVKSSAIIKGVPNQINLFDGATSGCVDVNYEAALFPEETLYVDLNNDNAKEAYEYVSMCYVLATPESSKHKMEFVFSDLSGKCFSVSSGLDLVPLFRNWRTNIIGWLFTGKADININVDPRYEDDFNVVTSNNGVYYNVSEDTTFENTVFVLGNYEEGATFASEEGQLITMNNVHFYGSVWTVVLGEYRGPKYHNYNNLLNNVTCTDLVVSNTIKDHDVYVSVGTCVYGNSTLNNCKMTGTTTVATVHFDGTPHDYTPVDLGIPNECDCIINNGEYGSMYLWTHAVVDLNNVKVGTIITSACNSTKHSNLTIGDGTTVDYVYCTQPAKYGSRLVIKEGATVGELHLVNASFKDMEINGNVGKIFYNDVEYTLDELKALGL